MMIKPKKQVTSVTVELSLMEAQFLLDELSYRCTYTEDAEVLNELHHQLAATILEE